MTEFRYPPLTLRRRWGAMPPWQAKRARAAWWRQNGENGQDPATQVALPERRPPRERLSGPRRLTTEELARRTARRVELDNPDFSGALTEEDLKIASPATITRMLNTGQIQRDLGGPPPRRG